MALLDVSGLKVNLHTARGQVQAVRGLDFSLERGETLGIVGESGCGKSMTALALMGLLPDNAQAVGRIGLHGQNLLEMNEAKLAALRGDRMAMIFQEPMTSLNPLHRIGEQIAEPLRLHRKMTPRQARERALDLLDRVGIPNPSQRIDAYPHQLSGGQRQRVMIAMALACEPDILVADEPTTALDVTIQGQILDLIGRLVDESGMALILISHDLGVIAETVDRVLVMYAGRAVEHGPVQDVFARMAHPYTRGLFAAMPRLHEGVAAWPRPALPTIAGIVPDLHDLADHGCAFAPRCSLADARCGQQTPPNTNLGADLGNDHGAACWHTEKTLAEKIGG